MEITKSKESVPSYDGQSQAHGFTWENDVRRVFGLGEESNNTDIHDIPCEKNKFNAHENISIKVAGGSSIDCGDWIRMFNNGLDRSSSLTMIIIHYKQQGHQKVIRAIYEVDYNEECHKMLFGTLSLDDINAYDTHIKAIPSGEPGPDTRNQYITMKNDLQKRHRMQCNISPKVDSHNQRRVQCSIPHFTTTLQKFITYDSTRDANAVNMLRGGKISSSIASMPRARGGITKEKMKTILQKMNVKGYSNLKKKELIEKLKEYGEFKTWIKNGTKFQVFFAKS
tara:strand:+ start:12894 stop:13739 length:846 start_codon:yes stop_codon:yes gene_type:complete